MSGVVGVFRVVGGVLFGVCGLVFLVGVFGGRSGFLLRFCVFWFWLLFDL